MLCTWWRNWPQMAKRMPWAKHPFSYSFLWSDLEFTSLKTWLQFLPERGWGNTCFLFSWAAWPLGCSSLSLAPQKEPADLVWYCVIAYEKGRCVTSSSHVTNRSWKVGHKWVYPDHRFTMPWREETHSWQHASKSFSLGAWLQSQAHCLQTWL